MYSEFLVFVSLVEVDVASVDSSVLPVLLPVGEERWRRASSRVFGRGPVTFTDGCGGGAVKLPGIVPKNENGS